MGSRESTIRSKAVGDRLAFRARHDPKPKNPRKEEVLTTIVAWHHKYAISDTYEYRDHAAFLESVRPEDTVRPLYMYDHGGVVLSTSPFLVLSDSASPYAGHHSQVGYVLVTPERIEALGLDGSDTEFTQRIIDDEVKEFEAYMNGNVYQVDVHRMVDGDVLETPVGTVGHLWDTDDATLDGAVIVLRAFLEPKHAEGVTDEMVAEAEWK